jgi:hypothetical protein
LSVCMHMGPLQIYGGSTKWCISNFREIIMASALLTE